MWGMALSWDSLLGLHLFMLYTRTFDLKPLNIWWAMGIVDPSNMCLHLKQKI